ncbi:MAG: BrnT family toxin, partial [Microcystis novacekii Mn_MB_F_20050700_S1]
MDESFEWDEDKNRLNQQKHDVSFELAQYAFFDPNRVIVQ